MCSRVFKGLILLAALGMAMVVGAVLGGGAVYVLTRAGDVHPAVEVRAGDRRPGLRLVIPHGVPVWGAMVREVIKDSPASAAGLQEGDVITALDEQPIAGPQSLVEAIAEREPGDEIELIIYRLAGGEKRNVALTLGEHPDQEGRAYLGVWLDGSFGGE